jgi:diacylglycerol O-acyltransferase
VPFGLQRPVWARPSSFDVRAHLRTETIEVVGSEQSTIEKLLVQEAAAALPGLWELVIVDGLPDGHWVLMAKIHLSLIDGLHGVDLLTGMLVPELVQPPADRDITAAPSPPRLVADAWRDLATNPYEQVRLATSFMRRFRQPLVRRPPRRAADVSLRRTVFPLEDLKAVRTALGGSVNDVLTSLLAAGVQAAESRTTPLRTAIPFAVRSLSRPGEYDNQIAVEHVDLPMGPADAEDRYRLVSAQLDRFARDNLAVGGRVLTRLTGVAPFLLLALGARACMRETADLCLVNAPGPPAALTAFEGRDMLDVYSVVPHPAGVRWSATARTYGRTASLALTATDAGALDTAIAGIEAELSALQAAAKRRGERITQGSRRSRE